MMRFWEFKVEWRSGEKALSKTSDTYTLKSKYFCEISKPMHLVQVFLESGQQREGWGEPDDDKPTT